MWQLEQRQRLPVPLKIRMSEKRIIDWYNHWNGNVYISFSGGKDSTVLLNIVRSLYKDVPAVFVDTGLEFPEIREFVKTIDNVEWIKPKKTFKTVIDKYGYPIISKETALKIEEIRTTKSDKLRRKRFSGDANGNGMLSKKWRYLLDAPFKISSKCCDVMKKTPVKKYERDTGRKPFVGSMAVDSRRRAMSYLQKGCNSFDVKRPMSTPIAFWKEEDIWYYLKNNGISYCNIYDKGYERTGCMFCMFGVHLNSENKFKRMKGTHPKLWNYCINKLELGKVLDYVKVPYE